MSRITFEDKLRFAAFQKLQLLQYSDRPVSFTHRHGNSKSVVLKNKAWRGVNFAPSHHKMVRLSSVGMVFTSRSPSDTVTEMEDRTMSGLSLRRRKGETPVNYFWRRHDNRPRTEFHRSFKPMGIRDDVIEKARERRAFTSFPFVNPTPYDHRGLDDSLPETRLVTLKTPDPFNIRLKTAALNDEYKQCYTDPQLSYGTRNISFKFRTFKTPEPNFDPQLLFQRGRYSPAFTAYNAYLDRINKTISS